MSDYNQERQQFMRDMDALFERYQPGDCYKVAYSGFLTKLYWLVRRGEALGLIANNVYLWMELNTEIVARNRYNFWQKIEKYLTLEGRNFMPFYEEDECVRRGKA